MNRGLGVIGGGNMAEALVRGVTASGLIEPGRILVYDILEARRDVFAAMGCVAADTPAGVLDAGVVLLATKPQTVAAALSGLALRPDHLLLSIAAGVPCARLEGLLPSGSRVVRVMPNTPLLVGMGMSALAAGTHARREDMDTALSLFGCCGAAVEVEEGRLDAVTALSGSGPAYLFAFAEALAAGGEELGLEPGLSLRLAAETLRGASEMLVRLGDPAGLRERVTSPGGTTAAALEVFRERGFADAVAAALTAARDRSAELGRG